MHLSETEQLILPSLELNAELPVPKLAKALGFSTTTVRNVIARLTDKGIIRYYPFIDVFPLGYRIINIYLSFHTKRADDEQRILKAIIAHPQVSWVCELGGEYRYMLSFVSRRTSDLVKFLETISSTAPGSIRRKAVMDQLSLTMFPAAFLAGKLFGPKQISWGGDVKLFDANNDDYRILTSMMAGATGMRELAKSLGCAPSSLYYRLDRLRRAGVFKGFVDLRNIHALGHSEFKINISVAHRTAAVRDQLMNFARNHPNVVFFVELMGTWDFEMDIELTRPSDAAQICDLLKDSFADDITELEIVPMLRELKVACLPLDPISTL